MQETVIKSINGLFSFLERLDGKYYFRGFSDYDRHMCPSIGRNGDNLINDEIKIIQEFAKLPELEELQVQVKNLHELLDLGQHYCLPTRLLDWTRNPLIALFFALGEKPFSGSEIFIALISIENSEISDDWANIDNLASYQFQSYDWYPFHLNEMDGLTLPECDEFYTFKSCVTHPQFRRKFYDFISQMNERMLITHQVNQCNNRIINQDGLFTVHREVKDIIPPNFLDVLIRFQLTITEKNDLSDMLSQMYNINTPSVLPKPLLGSPLEKVENWCLQVRNDYIHN